MWAELSWAEWIEKKDVGRLVMVHPVEKILLENSDNPIGLVTRDSHKHYGGEETDGAGSTVEMKGGR